jgi:hypothetical protein
VTHRSVVRLTYWLWWAAWGAAIGAGIGLWHPAWGVGAGFVAALARFLAAPVSSDIGAWIVVSLVSGLGLFVYSAFGRPGAVRELLLLEAPQWPAALLGLAYGFLTGTVLAASLARVLGRSADPELAVRLRESDRSDFGAYAARPTHRLLVALAIGLFLVFLAIALG